MFTRRALNTSFSNRTCKLGTLKGRFPEAVKKALELSNREGEEITIHDYDESEIVGLVCQVKLGSKNFIRIFGNNENM
jgi:hypothetical protein